MDLLMNRVPNGITYESQEPQRLYFDIAHAANPIFLAATNEIRSNLATFVRD